MILGGGMQLYAADKLADTIYRNGKIYTVTEDFHHPSKLEQPNTAEIVATLNGTIVFVGTEAEAKAQGYLDIKDIKEIDLKGKTMLPGFVDGHGHFPNQGGIDLFQANLNSPPIGTMESIEDYIKVLSDLAANTPKGCNVTGVGYDDTLVKEKRHPTKEDLNRASQEHPIVIKHTSEHLAAANSLAIKLSGLNSVDINAQGVYVHNGETYDGVYTKKNADGSWDFTGVFAETKAMGLLQLGAYDAAITDKATKGIARSSQVYAAAGVTTADQGASVLAMPALINGEYKVAGYALAELQQALDRGALLPRVVAHPLGYTLYGTLEMGMLNRMALGWSGATFEEKGSSPEMGADITSLALKNIAINAKAPEGLPENHIFMGAWKFIYDGSNQGYTGYFKSPGYWDVGEHGPGYNGLPSAVTYTKEKLEDLVDLYHRNDQSIEVHTNGSAAAEDYITAVEEAVAAHPSIKDRRHTSIHAQMMERQHIERLIGDYSKLDATRDMYTDLSGTAVDTDLRAALNNGTLMKDQNMIYSYFVYHAYFWGDRHLETFMGPGRGKNMNPAGWSAAMDQLYTFHNDTTVTPISPLRSLESAVTRLSAPTALGPGGTLVSGEGKDLDAKVMYPETKGGAERSFWNYDQRINVLQALHGVTIVPAYQNHLENRVGSIAEGKLADFVILDKDPFQIDPTDLAEMRVAATIVGGDVVHGILPASDIFVGQFAASYEQADGVSMPHHITSTLISPKDAEKQFAPLPKDTKNLGTVDFTADVTEGKSAVFQMNFLGNGAPLGSLQLHKLTANTATEYAYGKPSLDDMGTADGQWWVASLENPTVPITDMSTTLDMDHTYVAFLVIADNGDYDSADALGKIADPFALSTTGNLPNNGSTPGDGDGESSDDGSSSGCTVGSTPSYDLLVLFLGMSAVAAIRVLRRRNEQ